MTQIHSDAKIAYERITKEKQRHGKYHKVCFHLHTPESYDYTLLSGWEKGQYINSTDNDIYNICINKKIFPDAINIDEIQLNDVFISKKEMLSYLLIANEIMDSGIEMVVISDHNTVKGFTKLKKAVKILRDMKVTKVYPNIILGVEISCADKNHIIGIFDHSKENEVKTLLDEYIMDVKDGTYLNSIDILNFIKSLDGIGYIAHLDSSSIFKEHYLNGAYKKKLFDKKTLELIGLSNIDNAAYINSKIMDICNERKKVVLDNDAHNIDEISKKLFWIKGRKNNFEMLKEAMLDYDIAVNFDNTTSITQYIKGIYIQKETGGFLVGKDKDNFVMNFSNSLNCIIGGRGTGKSTVLEMIEFVLGQTCLNETQLDFICRHGNTWILYVYKDKEYLIEMIMPIKEYCDDSILQSFGQNKMNRYSYNYHFSKEDIKKYTLDNYLKVWEVSSGEKVTFRTVNRKSSLLNKLFDTRYSVNELVNVASSKELNNFIYKTISRNSKFSKSKNLLNAVKRRNEIKTILNDIDNILNERKDTVEKIINPFNLSQSNTLKITFRYDKYSSVPPKLKEWAAWGKKDNSYYNGKNIKTGNLIDYLFFLYDKLGVFDFLKMVVNNDVEMAFSIETMLSFCEDIINQGKNNNVEVLNTSTAKKLLQSVFQYIYDYNEESIKDYIIESISNIEIFSLEFNINNKEGKNAKPIFKPVNELSLGQKVVAMMSFILAYSEYAGDFSPLIIDQPEDNLDSQYIFKNLVNQLRNIKEKRQVIIATHNSTIVTNAKADLVCVMESDNEHGWIQTMGYPGEVKIKKHIINYLEGGKESFLHKIHSYQGALNISISDL